MSFRLIKTDSNRLAETLTSREEQILEGLNEEQRKAVQCIEKPLLIVAGAGSGKTRVITNRIAYLIEKGIEPYNILALTFTNKAANEMKERISALIDQNLASQIWAGTFHSIFARILRIEAEHLGYTRSFSIYDADDSLSLIKRIQTLLGISQQSMNSQAVRSAISWSKNQMINSAQYSLTAKSSTEKIIGQIYTEYESELKKSNSMDFDDLLINMIHLFEKNKEILEKYQFKFRHILVDEYQDTNRPQYLVCKYLSQKFKNLCVVGDDAQSIYKWRGAEIRNILEFQNDYPDAEVIRLERNYRSTSTILEAADSVIKNNKNQIPKQLWTDNEKGDPITLYDCKDEMDESEKIIKEAKKLIESQNYSPKNFAVLYRTNAQSLAFENACRKFNLAYIVIGGTSFYKRKEVKDVLSYLKIICNPKDNESFLRVLNEPPRGIGQTSTDILKKFANMYGISMYEAFRRAGEINELQHRAKNAVSKYTSYLDKFMDLKNSLDKLEFVKQYILESGLLDMYKDIGTDDAQDRWNNIQQVISDIALFFKNDPEKELEDYIQQISLISEIDNKDITQEQIKLMTLHSAKGLEFPVVFIAGIEKGLFPNFRSENDNEEEEEERRLFYVGITRAMKKLYLSYANRRLRFGEYQFQTKSKFINEIKKSLLVSDSPTRIPNQSGIFNDSNANKGAKPYQTRSIYNQVNDFDDYSQVEPEQNKLSAGDRVIHKNFGTGKIELITGEGINKQAIVYFTNIGRKKLMLQYAKLEKI